MKHVTNTVLREQIENVFIEHPDKVIQAKVNYYLIGWFVGQVMKKVDGKANPSVIYEQILKKFENEKK